MRRIDNHINKWKSSQNIIDTNMVTASLTTPAIVTVTALVTETRTYSVSTCKKIKIQMLV